MPKSGAERRRLVQAFAIDFDRSRLGAAVLKTVSRTGPPDTEV